MEISTKNKNHAFDKRCLDAGDNFIWLILALMIGVFLRGYFLDQPMRYDESFTFYNFINKNFRQLFFYALPNNHVLYTVLTKITTIFWGPHPATLRLVAFGSGIALIPIIYILCRKLTQSGVLASFALAVSPYFVLYSTNARGYTLLVVLSLCLAYIGTKITERLAIKTTSIFSLTAALGMLTMPSMLFSIAGIYLWILLLLLINGQAPKQILLKFAAPGVIITSIITTMFYIPVILVSNGIQPIIGNSYVTAQPWQSFISQMYPHFCQTFLDFTRDVPEALILAATILFIIGTCRAAHQKNWLVLLLLPSILSGAAIVFFVKQRIPFERTWIYIIPFFILVMDYGFAYIVSIVSTRMNFCLKFTLMIISVFLAMNLISKNAIERYPDTGTFPEAELAVKYLKSIMSTNDFIYANAPANLPLAYYLWYHNVPYGKTGEKYFVVKKSAYSINDLTDRPVKKLININDLALYQLVDASKE